MTIRDSEHPIQVKNERELDAFLAIRHDIDGIPANSFWMSHADEWPAISILVRDDLAHVEYMAGGEGPVFASRGDLPGLPRGKTTLFWSDGQQEPVSNHLIIPFTDAVRAAKEFLGKRELPASVRWLEL